MGWKWPSPASTKITQCVYTICVETQLCMYYTGSACVYKDERAPKYNLEASPPPVLITRSAPSGL